MITYQSYWPGGPAHHRLFKPFEKGERVKLTIKNYYRDDPYNPLWNGKQGRIAGTIADPGGEYKSVTGCFLDVRWDNGQRNTYRHIDLERLSSWEEHKLEDELFEI